MKRNPTPCFALLAKRSLFFVLCSLFFTACGMFPGQDTKTTYTASDLSGTWLEEYTLCYWVYTLTKDDSGEYYWGKTWDEADDVHESDLEYHGNGWFKWKLVEAELKELHLMDNDGAPIPKIYTVTKLTSSELVYKDNVNREHSFSKVVFKEGEDE